MQGVDYASGRTPLDYLCCKCEARGVKLWRYGNSSHVELMCGRCTCTEEGKEYTIDETGRRTDDFNHHTDQIGGMLPAVPDEEGISYWGYTSVPDDGCVWWRQLPLEPAEPGRSRWERLVEDDA